MNLYSLALFVIIVVFIILVISTKKYGKLSEHGCNERIHWVQKLDGHYTCEYCGKNFYEEEEQYEKERRG